MMLVPVRQKYVYEPLVRNDSPTGRTYGPNRLPSVTTILSATKDQTHLKAWVERLGEEEANKIKNEAATVGTHMHSVVERLLLNRPLPVPRSWLAVRGYWMGYRLIDAFMRKVHEVWGTEIPVYYPNKYAGTSDCIGIYSGKESVIDFKQTNQMKQRRWIDDYFVQTAAYAVAHNVVYGTNISQGVILMVAQDGQLQEFVSCGREFEGYKDKWMHRVEEYQKNGPELGLDGPRAADRGDDANQQPE